ncbi:aspartate-semialdehyde dehydrogenase [Streptomyces sp. WI03-4A]|uniref:aspartate-semialdehyde dehydrogenase n=1 Tax=Streptomyces sp. WI03-4A TaxID=3028706 RepID=UPI0029BCB032|nr:aspartate-semialdehyde dehydrogenase [Streptomyces sp. WI03-4A]MDX2590837.1 aspartate-semialdehyde dehydrogenase [Streptomyces sp. WI03-4A]
MTLVTDPAAPRIAIVGATGAVGNTLIELIEQRGLRYRDIQLVASARSAGTELSVDGVSYPVQAVEEFDFAGVDLAFFSAGTEASEQWVPKATAAGAVVIDNTIAFRMDPDTPLVVPQVNAFELDARPRSGVIANPNCSTIPLVRLLHGIERRYGVRQAVVSTYQAASGLGHPGVEELMDASRATLEHPEEVYPSKEFSPSLAFNVIPKIDRFLDSGFTLEEQKMLQESRKILGMPHLDVTTTCVRVPVVNGHSEAVWIETQGVVDREELVELLAALPEVTLHDRGSRHEFPTPATIDDPYRVHVGRVRVNPNNPRAFWLWLVADNLTIGAALNAIQIAEELIARGTL